MKKIIIGIALCFLIFGTNNYSELNHLAIITNVGIEKNKDNYNTNVISDKRWMYKNIKR